MLGLIFILILGNVVPFPTVSNQRPTNVTKNVENFQNEYIVLKNEQGNISHRKSGRTIHQTAWSKEVKDDSLPETSSTESETGIKFNFWSFKKLYDLVLNAVHKLKYFETILLSSHDNENETSLKDHKMEDLRKYTNTSQNEIDKPEQFYETSYLDLLKNRTDDYEEKEYSVNDSEDFDNHDYEIKLASGSNENQTYDENKSSYVEFQEELTRPESSQSLEKHDSTRTENLSNPCKSSTNENLPEGCYTSSVIVEEQKEATDYSKENMTDRKSKTLTSNFTETMYSIPISQKNISSNAVIGDEFQSNKNINSDVPLYKTFSNKPVEMNVEKPVEMNVEKPVENYEKKVYLIQNTTSLPRTEQHDSNLIITYPFHAKLSSIENQSTNSTLILFNDKLKNENINMESVSGFSTASTNTKSDILFVNDKTNATPLLEEFILTSSEMSSFEVMENKTKLGKGHMESTLESFTMKHIKDFELTTSIPLRSTQLGETLLQSTEDKAEPSHEKNTSTKVENPFMQLSETYFGNKKLTTRDGAKDSEPFVIAPNLRGANRLNGDLSEEDAAGGVKTENSNIVKQNGEIKKLLDSFPFDKNKQSNASETNSNWPINNLPKIYIDSNKVSNENPDKYENKLIKITPEGQQENINKFNHGGSKSTQEKVPTTDMILSQFYPKENIILEDPYSQLAKLTDKDDFTKYKDTDVLQYRDFEINKNLLIDTFQQLYPDPSRKSDSNEFPEIDERPKETFDTILQFLYKHSNKGLIQSLKNLTTHS